MTRIPDGVAVSVNERLVPHLAMRREVFIYPTGAGTSDYVLELDVALAKRPAQGHAEIARASGWVLLRR
jgi:hypothetical protein